MDNFKIYLDKVVKIDIHSSNFYYFGRVIDADKDFLSMYDKHNKRVTIAIRDIKSIREVN